MLSFLCEKAKESFLAGKVRWPSRKQVNRYCKAKSITKRLLQAIRPFNTGKRERPMGRIEGRKGTQIRVTGMIFTTSEALV